MNDTSKKYTNGELTVVWKPELCIHSTVCWKGLKNVFNPTKRPWISMDGENTQTIAEQVSKCPSGALSSFYNGQENETVEIERETIVEVSHNGPLLVYGNITIKDHEGKETKKNKVTALCRCGASSNKPYCDGTHNKIGFSG